jgi:alanine racemase
MSTLPFNKVIIDLAALRENYLSIQQAVGDAVRVMAIVKADAYGHGLLPVAQSLYNVGARHFGVAEVEEGIMLREAGLQGEIVVLLGPSAETLADIIGYRLTPVVFDDQCLSRLSAMATAARQTIGVHVKVDVGMGRLGVLPGELLSFCRKIEALPGIALAGVLSHLAMAEQAASAVTIQQLREFKDLLKDLAGHLPGKPVVHIANSAALFNNPDARLDMVRSGISLYGCYPEGLASGRTSLRLRPAMSFVTRILQVKEVPAGTGISYGHLFVTRRASRIAVLPVGYEDGYLRRLSNRAQVLIHGHRAPVCGRICMNACMVDITDLDESAEVRVGDEVVLMGRRQQEEITAEEVAGWLETITYEVFCLFGGRNKRIYVN